jgi:hypothetical protein
MNTDNLLRILNEAMARVKGTPLLHGADKRLIINLVIAAGELLDEIERLRAALIFIQDKEQAALSEAERLRFNIPEDAGCMEIIHAASAALEQKP